MALPQGLNFRATAGYVTDGANEDKELTDTNSSGTPEYPVTTAQGNNVGYEAGSWQSNPRDRNSGNDRRLAGTHSVSAASATKDYRIDLPATGSHNVRIALGDGTYTTNTKCELIDTSTSLGVLASGSTGAGNSFKDAANATYTAANWPGSNTAATVTFASTICRFRMGDGANTCSWAHLYIESAGGGGGAASRLRFPSSLSGVGSGGVFLGDRLQ